MSVIQMVSSNASLSPQQIAEARISPSQPLFFQLYKHKDDAVAAAHVREVEELGYNAIFLTVDAPIAGNRERDIRAPFEIVQQEREVPGEGEGKTEGEMPRAQGDAAEQEDEEADGLGTAGALLKNDDLDMSWDRVRHFRYQSGLVSQCSIACKDHPLAPERYQATDRY